MPVPIVKIGDREIPLRDAVTTLGRASDNTVAVPGDSNVSRYHAEIEQRGEDHYLIDLGSSNGTTVNGEKFSGERLLREGDQIVLGGSAKMEFGSATALDETPASEDMIHYRCQTSCHLRLVTLRRRRSTTP